jgi:hypothetical protein
MAACHLDARVTIQIAAPKADGQKSGTNCTTCATPLPVLGQPPIWISLELHLKTCRKTTQAFVVLDLASRIGKKGVT